MFSPAKGHIKMNLSKKTIFFEQDLVDWAFGIGGVGDLEVFCNNALAAHRDAAINPAHASAFFYLRTLMGADLAEIVEHWNSHGEQGKHILLAASRAARTREVKPAAAAA
jgi:hypothetical protein